MEFTAFKEEVKKEVKGEPGNLLQDRLTDQEGIFGLKVGAEGSSG